RFVADSPPNLRSRYTARPALDAAGMYRPTILAVLPREREFGVLYRPTKAGIEARFPDQAAARAFLGKFFHRPPGGESWADVALRLRSLLDSVGRQYAGERLLVVGHQVVILVLRYLLERLSEQQILAIDRAEAVANCSLT